MTKEVIKLAEKFEEKYAGSIPPGKVDWYMRDLELSIQDLNDLYESGNIDPAAKTTLHWVVKRLDAMIFSMKKGQV